MHKALREAMVNTLIHADYRDRASVEVIKQPSGFVFRNPGVLRVPAMKALQGGVSDCRNRSLQQMFLMIGLGERAGSGMAKIQQGWQHTGGKLALLDSVEPFDQTWLKMGFPCASDSHSYSGRVAVNVAGKMAGKMAEMVAVKVLELMTENPDITIPDIAVTLGKSKRFIERAVRELKSNGKIDRAGSPRRGRWVVGNSTSTKSI